MVKFGRPNAAGDAYPGLVAVPLCLLARASFALSGRSFRNAYTTSMLRPESSIIGILIALGVGWGLPILVAYPVSVLSGAALIFGPDIHTALGTVFVCISSALFAGSLLHLTLYSKSAATIFRFPFLSYLGKISFGLCVFHLWSLRLSFQIQSLLNIPVVVATDAKPENAPCASPAFPINFVARDGGAMDARVTEPKHQAGQSQSDRLYLPSLDGLRLVAFLLVFIHHLPSDPHNVISLLLKPKGWVGVELFFAISAYLFFHLMAAEWEKTGKINVGFFFARRLLRLYPLMVIFPAVMLLVFAHPSAEMIRRLIGLATFSDNFLTASSGYSRIPYSAQMWTLSFEFQLYAIIPFAFLAYRYLGWARFIAVLAFFEVLSISGRFWLVSHGTHHPVIWVISYLRPESAFMGMALAIMPLRRWLWLPISLAGLLSLIAFAVVPNVQVQGLNQLVLYPITATLCGAAVWLSLNARVVRQVLSYPVVVYLGKISFGLYVYHLLAIGLAAWLPQPTWLGPFAFSFLAGLVLVIAMAALSYKLIEQPIDRLKQRFQVVPSRPALAHD